MPTTVNLGPCHCCGACDCLCCAFDGYWTAPTLTVGGVTPNPCTECGNLNGTFTMTFLGSSICLYNSTATVDQSVCGVGPGPTPAWSVECNGGVWTAANALDPVGQYQSPTSLCNPAGDVTLSLVGTPTGSVCIFPSTITFHTGGTFVNCDLVQTDCCEPPIPTTLFVTFVSPCSGLDALTFTVVWNGIDSWVGSTTMPCTTCVNLELTITCTSGVFSWSVVIDDGEEGCLVVEIPDGCTDSIDFDCDTWSGHIVWCLSSVRGSDCCDAQSTPTDIYFSA